MEETAMKGTNSARNPKSKREAAQKKQWKIAIVGLPNTGKSQVFNDLTGDYTLVSNYPLTTVEVKRKICKIRNEEYEVIDTPGLHCLYIHSEEEIVVRDLLFSEEPDGVIQCIDANRLKQSLLLTLDLIELGIPMMISLNAINETEQQGIKIDVQKLAELIGLPVVEHIASLNKGVEELKDALSKMAVSKLPVEYGEEIEGYVASLQALFPTNDRLGRKKSLLLLEEDRLLLSAMQKEYQKRIVDGLEDELTNIRIGHRGNMQREINSRRNKTINAVTSQVISLRQKEPGNIARIFARLSRHPVFGFPILAFFLISTYLLVVHGAGFIERLISTYAVDPLLEGIEALIRVGFWRDFLIGDYGIITLGFFNAVVTVLPILSVFFLVMGFLEDIGYLPNLTVLTRRVLEKIGLSGRSVMSIVLGFGCKTMATLTTKGISSRKEKFIAVTLIAFAIPCSAQLAIDMAILGRVGVKAFLIASGMLAMVEITAGFILNKVMKEETSSDYVQELPPIRIPSVKAIGKKTFYRIVWFLKEAVPIFIIAAVVLFVFERTGLLGLLKQVLKPVVNGWLGLPLDVTEVLILSFARHEAAAAILLNMVDEGMFTYVQSIVAVVITTMFVPCFANIVAICKELGVAKGITITLVINISSFVLAGTLHWILIFLQVER